MSDVNTTGTAVAERKAPHPIAAGNLPRAIVPVDLEGAWRIANAVWVSGMAPKSMKSGEACMIAILHGLEVGLTPMNALQSIAVVNGRPTIWGDGAVGLIRASGLLEYMKEWFEGEGDDMIAYCEVKRKGESEPVRDSFSMKDAKKAGLLAKEGPWQTYPKRMLKMRARWPLRDTFADVLKGLAIKEEMEDLERLSQPDMATLPPPPPEEPAALPPPPPEEDVTDVEAEEVVTEASGEVAEASAPADDAEAGFPGDTPLPPAPADEDGIPASLRRKPAFTEEETEWHEGLEGAFSGCEDFASLADETRRLMEPMRSSVSSRAWKRANELMHARIAEIEAANEEGE